MNELKRLGFCLTEEEKDWFGDRIDESDSGRVIVPSHLYSKFRKIVEKKIGFVELSNMQIKCYLIDTCF